MMINKPSPDMLNPIALIPVHPKIEKYMRSLVWQSDHTVLTEMERQAEKLNFPIVNRLVGVFLETMARSISARRIFEFGSGFGYSAYWFAKAVGAEGEVICSDGDPENQEKAHSYLKQAGLWKQVNFNTGLAQEVFSRTEGFFDICYNDVDKGDYPSIWQMAKDRIRPGGLYIADNVLWHGRVAVDDFEDIVPGWTEAIMEHNQLVFDDPDFDSFINPTRDGVMVARKKDR